MTMAASPDRAILFRFGVDIGDAITDGTDFHGDVVNVAARLQAECPPGGICVTRAVRDHMRGRLDLEFEELGALELKNIAYRVEAFVLHPSRPRQDPAEATKAAVAILTVSNVRRDTSSIRGLAGELISELSRRNSIIVIAPKSSFVARDYGIDVTRRGMAGSVSICGTSWQAFVAILSISTELLLLMVSRLRHCSPRAVQRSFLWRVGLVSSKCHTPIRKCPVVVESGFQRRGAV